MISFFKQAVNNKREEPFKILRVAKYKRIEERIFNNFILCAIPLEDNQFLPEEIALDYNGIKIRTNQRMEVSDNSMRLINKVTR